MEPGKDFAIVAGDPAKVEEHTSKTRYTKK
jgi:hypothetical protein